MNFIWKWRNLSEQTSARLHYISLLATQGLTKAWTLDFHMRDLTHNIKQKSSILKFFRTPALKISFQTISMLFWGWILGKIRSSQTLSLPTARLWSSSTELACIKFAPTAVFVMLPFVMSSLAVLNIQSQGSLRLKNASPRNYFLELVQYDEKYGYETMSISEECDDILGFHTMPFEFPEVWDILAVFQS